VNETHEHLTDEQLHALLDAQLLRDEGAVLSPAYADARRHLDLCADCRKVLRQLESVSRRLATLKDPSGARPEGECPAEADLRRLLVQELPADVAEELMKHVTRCDHCAAILREVAEDLVFEPTGAEQQVLEHLDSSEAEWQARLARQLAQARPDKLSSAIQVVPQIPRWNSMRWLLAAAAVLLVAFSSTGLYLLLHKPSLDQLLVSAYSEKRTLELRIPGASYAPLPVERGPSALSASPPALLEAEIRIQKEFRHHGNDPGWLAAKGRAKLLAHNPDAAIQDLKNALALSPGLFTARLDLASAYSERAAAKNQPWDNAEATEILTGVLRERPQNPVAIFNLALILERQSLFHEAAEQWQNYLKLDPSGGWADEARRNLERDENQIRNMSRQSGLLDASQVAAASSAGTATIDDTLDRRAEDYLWEATAHWLPQAFPIQSDSPFRSDYQVALRVLAEVLQTRHRDEWLSDLLSRAKTPAFSSGISLLAQSVAANNVGDYAEGTRSARLAAIRFSGAENPAGGLRSRLEEVYSLRLSHNATECNRLGEPLVRELAGTGYAWAIVQATLEHQECLNMRGELGQALSLSDTSLDGSQLARYPQLYLRSAFFAADTEASLGNTKDAWRRTRDGLVRAWDSANSPMRTYSFDTELDLLADRTGRTRFDEVVLREALQTLGTDPDILMRAMANHRLAQVALAADDPETAGRYFQKAVELFSAAAPTDVTANHRTEAEIGLARVEIRQKQFPAAADRLRQLRPEIDRLSNRYLQIDFFQTLGEAYLRLNRSQDADAALCSALHLTETALDTLQSDSDRLDWDHAAGRTYRTLAESRLNQQDALGALEFWEWYKASTIRPARAELASPKFLAKFPHSDSSAGCSLPSLHAVRDALPSLVGAMVISYAVLPSGIAAWAYDDRGVTFHWISGEAAPIFQQVEHFAQMCATPTSDQKTLYDLGRVLYDRLLQPFRQILEPNCLLVFEPDDALWSTPFPALIRPDGRYLSDFSAISEFPGIYYRNLLRPNGHFEPSAAAVAVSEDRAIHFQEEDLPALPNVRSEVEAVTEQLPHTTILRNEEARLPTLTKHIAQAEVFHFAGHAIQLPEGAALLVAGPSATVSVLDARAFASMHFPRLRLAVLSACSTEAGEEANGLLDSGSLARVLMRGGVSQVVATRWAIDSASTEDTIKSFYGNLLQGASVPDALRFATRHARTRPSTPHPYYWAAFASFGST
jgi:CHAT domain-containing protein/cytochrome c-type biogenesis protein CcmH/NrfG